SDIKDAGYPGYTVLGKDKLPDGLQQYFVAEETLPSSAFITEGLHIDKADFIQIIQCHTLEGEGLKARIYQSDTEKQLIFVFSGTESKILQRPVRAAENWTTDFEQGLGLCSDTYKLAIEWVKQLQYHYPDYEVTCTGISLGGGLSQYAAAYLGLRAYCFNAAWLEGCQLDQIQEGDYSASIKHIAVDHEILSVVRKLLIQNQLGSVCHIPSYDPTLNDLERHLTRNTVRSLQEYVAALKNKPAA
ncbi:MAG TPA: hypothetical protein PLV25_01210, partial [Opitutales bacterium]|nr:hypothetical protein [Opitutales bacterium]